MAGSWFDSVFSTRLTAGRQAGGKGKKKGGKHGQPKPSHHGTPPPQVQVSGPSLFEGAQIPGQAGQEGFTNDSSYGGGGGGGGRGGGGGGGGGDPANYDVQKAGLLYGIANTEEQLADMPYFQAFAAQRLDQAQQRLGIQQRQAMGGQAAAGAFTGQGTRDIATQGDMQQTAIGTQRWQNAIQDREQQHQAERSRDYQRFQLQHLP